MTRAVYRVLPASFRGHSCACCRSLRRAVAVAGAHCSDLPLQGERLEAHVATTSDLRVNVAVMVIKNGFLRLMDLPGEFTNRARCCSVAVVVTADVGECQGRPNCRTSSPCPSSLAQSHVDRKVQKIPHRRASLGILGADEYESQNKKPWREACCTLAGT